jgi:hypothetical protein
MLSSGDAGYRGSAVDYPSEVPAITLHISEKIEGKWAFYRDIGLLSIHFLAKRFPPRLDFHLKQRIEYPVLVFVQLLRIEI